MEIFTIYDYFLKKYLEKISKLKLEIQVKLIKNYNIAILDYCGMMKSIKNFFPYNTSFFLMENINEIFSQQNEYDIIYILYYEKQYISVNFPCIKIKFTNDTYIVHYE